MPADPVPSTVFVYVTCQVGAEPALKEELAREWPTLHLAFSRPGFLTFKSASPTRLPEDWNARLVFARASGFCLGKVTRDDLTERARQVWKFFEGIPLAGLQVWPRDRYTPGFRDYEPGLTPESRAAEELLQQTRPAPVVSEPSADAAAALSQDAAPPTAPGGTVEGLVADVILVSDNEWWVGCHKLRSVATGWPGGLFQSELPPDVVSRAWLKMQEAVAWSEFDLQPGQKCIEIGSAPGGASQYLLSQGLHVIGVDPAVMHPDVLAHPDFRHIRKRSKEVPRQEFQGVDWLTCDINLPPNYTVDTVKAIVTHPGVQFQGLLLTLKLVDWSLARDLPKLLGKIRSWGFRQVTARQLHHNRQEVCVAASGFQAPRKAVKPAKKARKAPPSRPGPPKSGRRRERGPVGRKPGRGRE